MKITIANFRTVVAAMLVFLAAACGGGGAGNDDADGDEVEVQPDPDAAPDPLNDDVPTETPDVDADAPEDADLDLDAAEDAVVDPLAPFDRFCRGEPWDGDLVPGKAGELLGDFAGYYRTYELGVLETMKVVPQHPFQVTAVRLDFTGGDSGVARIRLMAAVGRSYPLGYPDLDAPGANLMEPVDLSVIRPEAGDWVEIDVSGQEIFLLPTEHYLIVYEHLAASPYLAVEEVVTGDWNRALVLIPGEFYPYGTSGNLRMELEGNYFCMWTDDERLFAEDTDQPFAEDSTQYAKFTDLDGDRHDDLVSMTLPPRAYLGDGAGGFDAPAFDPFPDAADATMLVFADLDNDGDRDAFAAVSLTMDSDGDGTTILEGDCNDREALVYPSAPEVADNGLDDDCDGVTDDGTDISDTDLDGVTIADGDCDDNRNDVHPGAAEIRDSRDNDCDLGVDEDFVNTVQLNDGTGRFSLLPASGVEVLDSSPAAAFGDGNGDGVLDLYWTNWRLNAYAETAAADRYMTGNGDGTFTDALSSAGMTISPARAGYGVLWVDYNNDGLQDVWVGNYYNSNMLFENQGGGLFLDVAEARAVNKDMIGSLAGCTFGGDFGDIDSDGDMDLYTANLAHVRLRPESDTSLLLVSDGPPDYVFQDMTASMGMIYDEGDVNAAFGDFDNDMDLDLAVASLYPGHFSRLYRNDGPAGFTDVTYETNTAVNDSVMALWSDVDEDGDLDLLIVDRSGTERMHLFINRIGQDLGWVELLLQGTSTNRDAVGSRVTLTAGSVTQVREVRGGGGHSNAQSSAVVHFGLGTETAVGSLTVRWAGGGTETFTGVAPGGRYLLVEGSGAASLL